MQGDNLLTQPLTAVVSRRIKPGSEARFELLMQEFMAFVLKQPGHLGINVVRASPDSREYTVFDRFAAEEDRRRFTASSEYRDWMARLREVSEAEPDIQEMGGLAFWFNMPGHPAQKPPPRIKMALLTVLGVYPLSILIPAVVNAVVPFVPLWWKALLVACFMVASLTWVVMPGLTRLFERWLFSSDQGVSQ